MDRFASRMWQAIVVVFVAMTSVATPLAAGGAGEHELPEERISLEVGYMPILPVAQLFVIEGADAAEAFSAFREDHGRPARIATFPAGSVPHTTLRYWLDVVHGIPIEHVEITTMGSDQVQQALLSGSVDGVSILEPILTIVEERNPGMRVVARADELFPGQPGAVIADRIVMLGGSPARIVREYRPAFERPPRYDDAEFQRLATEIRRDLDAFRADPAL